MDTMAILSISTHSRACLVDITSQVEDVIRTGPASSGICVVYVPHTTAGVTVNECADPDVVRDILDALERAVPWTSGYRHTEGNSAAHAKASMIGSSVTIPYVAGRLSLGTWQGIFLCEFDGPRRRSVDVSLVPSSVPTSDRL